MALGFRPRFVHSQCISRDKPLKSRYNKVVSYRYVESHMFLIDMSLEKAMGHRINKGKGGRRESSKRGRSSLSSETLWKLFEDVYKRQVYSMQPPQSGWTGVD